MPFAILHDGARRRAGLEAARVLAMHAAGFADEPFEIAGLGIIPFGEAHDREHVRAEIEGVFEYPHVLADFWPLLVPIDASGLAGLAAGAVRNVDELHDLDVRFGSASAMDGVAETRMTSRGWNVVIVILPYATG